MPTKYTAAVGKLLRSTALRKSCLQSYGSEISVSWEYVPILECIRKHPGCMQVDISNRLKVTPAAVTQSTKKLENAGLITKETDQDNLRAKRMYITDRGDEMLKKGTQIFDDVDMIMFNGFSDEELDVLAKMLDRISTNISEHTAYRIENNKIPWEFDK